MVEGTLVQDGKGRAKERLSRDKIEEFIQEQVVRRGSDERTVKAYRLDLEHLYRWLGEGKAGKLDRTVVEDYLEYLMKEKKLRSSTVTRKYRVLNYYLSYLSEQGLLPDHHPLSLSPSVSSGKKERQAKLLSKAEIDLFFAVIEREYVDLESDFRRRVCLRDLVMMELLFYHGIEVSELLRIKITDYDRKAGTLDVCRKRGGTKSIYLYSKALRERMEGWMLEHIHFEHEAEYREQMFLSKLGKPLSMKMVINIFEKYRELAGIEKAVTPRDLKGSMGTYARELMQEVCG